jgi:hypothetical protein
MNPSSASLISSTVEKGYRTPRLPEEIGGLKRRKHWEARLGNVKIALDAAEALVRNADESRRREQIEAAKEALEAVATQFEIIRTDTNKVPEAVKASLEGHHARHSELTQRCKTFERAWLEDIFEGHGDFPGHADLAEKIFATASKCEWRKPMVRGWFPAGPVKSAAEIVVRLAYPGAFKVFCRAEEQGFNISKLEDLFSVCEAIDQLRDERHRVEEAAAAASAQVEHYRQLARTTLTAELQELVGDLEVRRKAGWEFPCSDDEELLGRLAEGSSILRGWHAGHGLMKKLTTIQGLREWSEAG